MAKSTSECTVACLDDPRGAWRLFALACLIALAVGACGGVHRASDQQQVTQVLCSDLRAHRQG